VLYCCNNLFLINVDVIDHYVLHVCSDDKICICYYFKYWINRFACLDNCKLISVTITESRTATEIDEEASVLAEVILSLSLVVISMTYLVGVTDS
jgi:hypothetical protein